MGEECWCGTVFGRYKRASSAQCGHSCGGVEGQSFECGGAFRNSIYSNPDPLPVPAKSSSAFHSVATTKSGEPAEPGILYWPPDVILVAGHEGESCNAACDRAAPEWLRLRQTDSIVESAWATEADKVKLGSKSSASSIATTLRRKATNLNKNAQTVKCNAELMPLIHTNCEALKELMGCTTCIPAQGADEGWISPALDVSSGRCYTSKGQYLTCHVAPPANKRRACVCEMT
jgi:hypothetical protein